MPKRSRNSSPPPPPRLLHRLPVPIPRHRSFQNFTLDTLISKIQSSSSIVILAGAGISTSCGIKDFRSPNSGIYSLIAASKNPFLSAIGEPQEVFNFETFSTEPEIFYAAAPIVLSSMLQTSTPSLTHQFITKLEEHGKLSTCFTQNIDGLEEKAGLSSSRLIQCHGDLKHASCLKCSASVPIEQILPVAMTGNVPLCEKQIQKRTKTKSGSSSSSSKQSTSISCGGVMKPSCVFFYEPLPSSLLTSLQEAAKTADLLLIIGTSLNVAPVNLLPRMVKSDIPVVLINKERISSLKSVEFDLELIGDADVIVNEIIRQLKWSDHLSNKSLTIVKSSSVSPVYIVSKL